MLEVRTESMTDDNTGDNDVNDVNDVNVNRKLGTASLNPGKLRFERGILLFGLSAGPLFFGSSRDFENNAFHSIFATKPRNTSLK